ncbi:hypothetical protein TRFO_38509 [Tritrichomonas foetus]|uniref:Tubby C-terminal domain-containing protein n=1 Tax=Tritrichomonas foetus TaxID=1144522 RepID=A0A1J4J8A4_9EUKA|nr:hypothetical protein TRFO_38509 [Tritrichomonas foetus]|eukprot:OHS95368.1 hypothetical protein TRFO_38509 [Tritrichomonas foetus]
MPPPRGGGPQRSPPNRRTPPKVNPTRSPVSPPKQVHISSSDSDYYYSDYSDSNPPKNISPKPTGLNRQPNGVQRGNPRPTPPSAPLKNAQKNDSDSDYYSYSSYESQKSNSVNNNTSKKENDNAQVHLEPLVIKDEKESPPPLHQNLSYKEFPEPNDSEQEEYDEDILLDFQASSQQGININAGNNQINNPSNNQINNPSNNQINNPSNNQINNPSNNQVNNAGNNQINNAGNNQVNNAGNNQINNAGNNQINNAGNNDYPQYFPPSQVHGKPNDDNIQQGLNSHIIHAERQTDALSPDPTNEENQSGILYRVTRAKKSFMKYDFQLYKGEEVLMCAKSPNVKRSVLINDGNIPPTKDNTSAVMKIKKKQKNFILYQGNKNGPIIMICDVSTVKAPIFYDRFFTVQMKEPNFSLKTMLPRKREDGKYTLNFGGKFTKMSIKNAILMNDNEEKVLCVRRIGEHDIEIEVFQDVSLLQIFGFAIVSWVCPY